MLAFDIESQDINFCQWQIFEKLLLQTAFVQQLLQISHLYSFLVNTPTVQRKPSKVIVAQNFVTDKTYKIFNFRDELENRHSTPVKFLSNFRTISMHQEKGYSEETNLLFDYFDEKERFDWK